MIKVQLIGLFLRLKFILIFFFAINFLKSELTIVSFYFLYLNLFSNNNLNIKNNSKKKKEEKDEFIKKISCFKKVDEFFGEGRCFKVFKENNEENRLDCMKFFLNVINL